MRNYFKRYKSFTLAEIMIALSVIGIIIAILLPVAFQATPNEKVMKFKKANATLAKAINELVTSGEYYTPGDLGVKPDGSLLDFNGEIEEDAKYLCNTIANLLNVKSINCSNVKNGASSQGETRLDLFYDTLDSWANIMDNVCKNFTQAGEEIVLLDNTVFYQTSPWHHFGIEAIYIKEDGTEEKLNKRLFTGFIGSYDSTIDKTRDFNYIYKPFCIDIDGIGKGEDPFGYGIRADGKIILGARAQEWLEKDIQDKD